jgi:uncharacterized protein YndB with AHSA1/START domain
MRPTILEAVRASGRELADTCRMSYIPVQAFCEREGGRVPTTGHYSSGDGQPEIRFERTFPHPVTAVWAAITSPGDLAAWFPTTVEFGELATGAPITFRFAQDGYPDMEGEVREVRPHERFVFTWGEDVLDFELAPGEEPDSCRLAFTVALDAADKAARDGAGWEACLDALAVVAGGEHPQRPLSEDSWRAYYEEYQQRGFPAGAGLPD